MNKPQWQIDIEERHKSVEAGPYAWEFVSDDNTCCVGVVLDDAGKPLSGQIHADDGEVAESIAREVPGASNAAFLAASWSDISHLLAALDKMREALKIFACNEHPKILTDGSLPSCCVATQALNFDPTQQTKQEGGK